MPATSRPRRASGAPALGVLLAALVLLAAPARPLAAQPQAPPVADPATIAGPIPAPGATSREVPRLAVEIYESVLSPFCPGLLLSNCPSPSADSLRTAIAERVERGDTRAEIEAELYATYGESIRGAPKAEGLGLVAWLAPAVVLLGGGAWIALWLRGERTRGRERRAAAPVAAPTLAGTGADAARAEELARLDRLVRGEGGGRR
jgi:cytochrome c-type biogenesis protein CcmH/NrfF